MTEKDFTGTIVGAVHTGDQFLQSAEIGIADGVITSLTPTPDAGQTGDTLVVPGFVDLHNHGGAGGGFPTGGVEECVQAALHHRSHGTTTLLASLVSAPGDELVSQTALLTELARQGHIAGVHMEGPFIASSRCGAQNPDYIIPGDPALFTDVIEAGEGWLKSVTFAPETENVDKLFELCAANGVIASLGHTDADFVTTAAAVERGREIGAQVTATHLFNAMPPVHHRAPGAAAALLTAGNFAQALTGDIALEVIADGVHLADETVDMVLSGASDAAFAVTDAMAAAGMPDGDYILGHLGVTVVDGVARLTEGGAIAGGTSVLAQQFLRRFGRERAHGHSRADAITTAVRLTSTNAARVFSAVTTINTHTPGRLVVGERANLVAFERDQLAFTVADGARIDTPA